ncbi:Haloacid dehalogenase-like hydrolase [Schizosaccharomyces pombe]
MPSKEIDINQKKNVLPKPEDIQLIICDVDGTLLGPDHKPHPRNLRALKYLRENYPQLPFVLATGRQRTSVGNIREALGLHVFPCVHLNGCVVYDKGEIVACAALKNSLAIDIIDKLKDIKTCALFGYDEDYVYQIKQESDKKQHGIKFLRLCGETVKDDANEMLPQLKGPKDIFNKMVVFDDDTNGLEEAKKRLAGIPSDEVALTQALPQTFEIIPPNDNKGVALKNILSKIYPSISLENVLAFGDGANDVCMFELAGYSVAIRSGMPVALKAAKAISDVSSAEGAVGEVLERIYNIPPDFN